jgi:hypothetical protein
MGRYLTENGEKCTGDDPARLLWHGSCGYWTDDWDKLAKQGNLPVCPTCNGPGYQAKADAWFGGADKYERNGHPRYREWLETSRETCGRPEYQSWLEQQTQEENP